MTVNLHDPYNTRFTRCDLVGEIGSNNGLIQVVFR